MASVPENNAFTLLSLESHFRDLETVFGTLTNSADPDQMPQNVSSDQGLHFLLIGISIKNKIKMNKYTPLNLIEKTHPVSKDGAARHIWVK